MYPVISIPTFEGRDTSDFSVSEDELNAQLQKRAAHYLKLAVGFFSILLSLISILDVLFLGVAAILFVITRLAVAVMLPVIWYKTRNADKYRFLSIHIALTFGLLHTLWITSALNPSAGLFYLHLMAAVYLLTPVFVLWSSGHMVFQWSVAAILILLFSFLIPDALDLYLHGGLVLLLTAAAGVLIPKIAHPFRRDIAMTRVLLQKARMMQEAALEFETDESSGGIFLKKSAEKGLTQPNSNNQPRFVTYNQVFARRLKNGTSLLELVDVSELISEVLKDVSQKSLSNNVKIKLIRPKSGLMAWIYPDKTRNAVRMLFDELISEAVGMTIQVMVESNEQHVLIHITLSKSGIAANNFEEMSEALDEMAPMLDPYFDLQSLAMIEAVAQLHTVQATLLQTQSENGAQYIRLALPVADRVKKVNLP